MSQTTHYRRKKVEDFLEKLCTRRSVLVSQLQEKEFERIQDIIIGGIKELDMIIAEMSEEFNLHVIQNETHLLHDKEKFDEVLNLGRSKKPS